MPAEAGRAWTGEIIVHRRKYGARYVAGCIGAAAGGDIGELVAAVDNQQMSRAQQCAQALRADQRRQFGLTHPRIIAPGNAAHNSPLQFRHGRTQGRTRSD